MFMKKTLAIVICVILVIIIGAVCFINATSYLKIEQNVERITVRNGNTGEIVNLTNSHEMLWSSIFVTLVASKFVGLLLGVYWRCQIISRVFHTALRLRP
jgi:hypothetical protein